MFNQFACGIKNRNAIRLAGRAEVNIPVGINRHAVGAFRAKERFIRQRTVGQDVVAPGFVVADVGGVKGFAIRRAGDAVGFLEIINDRAQDFAIGGQKINLLARHANDIRVRPAATVKRVGEIQRAIRRDPDIVGAVQNFSGEIGEEHGNGFVRRDAPQFVPGFGAGDEVALRVKHQAIRAASGLQERGEFAARAPFEDAVVRLIGEIKISLSVAGRAFGKGETGGEFFELGVRSDDALGGSSQGSGEPDEGEERFHLRKNLAVMLQRSHQNRALFFRAGCRILR